METTFLKLVLNNLGKLKTWGAKVFIRFKFGRVRIIVFGAGGVGKTTFKDYVLKGKKALLTPVKPDESFDIEYCNFDTEDFYGELIISPGQKRRIELHWPLLASKISKEDINGIVYICSYGHHSLRETNYKNHDLYNNGDTKTQFFKKYQQDCLSSELKSFENYIVPTLQAMKNPPWILFIISKQDLWWAKKDEVRDYYQNDGEFHQALMQVVEKQKLNNLKIEFCEVCFRAENLETKQGVVLAAINKGYTDKERIHNIEKVLKVMFDMINAQIRIKW